MRSIARGGMLVVLAVATVAAGSFAVWHLLRNPVADVDNSPERTTPTAAEPSRPERPPRPSEAYVGSAACAECHAEIHERYQTHPMGRSLASIEEAVPIEDYTDGNTFLAPLSPRWDLRLHYTVEARGDEVWHRETAVDLDGNVVYEHGAPIAYAVGSGQRGRSYFINRDGLLQMSPITWYSEEGRWNLSPGYQAQNLHFERRILDGCVGCHAGRMASLPGRAHCFEPEPFIEQAIGCERCHGPGRDHVEYHRHALYDQSPDPIVNPADLEPQLRESVCFQCHLVGETRFPRYGRTDFDFRPGDHLSDIWAVFVRGTGVAHDRTTSAVSQAEQMLASTCYQQSGGKMSCTSCHDPHSVPAPAERISFYRQACLACHGPSEIQCSVPVERRTTITAEDSCIVCHMPKIDANDVPHTSQTDHRLLRSPEFADDSAVSRTEASVILFGADAGRVTRAELERARGLYLVLQAERTDNKLLAYEAIPRLQAWLDTAPDDVPAAEALGIAHWMNRDIDAAHRIWTQALSLDPQNENLLRRLVVLHHESGQVEEGLKYGRRLTELNPWEHEHFGRLAHMLGQQGEFDEAISAAEKALEINPSAARIHAWLAEVYALKGDDERRRHHQQLFEKLSAPR